MVVVVLWWGCVAAGSDSAAGYLSERVNAIATACVAGVVVSAASMGGDWQRSLLALALGAGWGIVMEVLSVVRPGAVGGGDARMGAWVVAAAVWSVGAHWGLAIVAAIHVTGGVAGLARGRKEVVAGGWLAGACAIAATAGIWGVGS